MFEVKGWSITAPLNTQTGPVTAPTLSAGKGAKASESESKKRKHEHVDAETAKADPKLEKKLKKLKDTTNRKELGKEEEKVSEISEKTDKKKTKRSKSADEGQKEEKRPKKDKAQTEKKLAASSKQTGPSAEELKEKKIRKKEKKAKKAEDADADDRAEKSNPKESISKTAKPHNAAPTTITKLTPLQASMQAKLASARFRHLNETLYTSGSEKALDMFTNNPEMFDEYHSGFRQQVEVWPTNPVDGFIADIKRRGAVKSGGKDGGSNIKALVRTHGTCTIADLGCGDAKLASELQKSQQLLQVKILSYDLHSPSPLVERADIANLPLADGSVNTVIFCLALMGTNWPDFIDEAYRILHWKGELWIAEIKSRFGRVEKKAGPGKVVEHSVGHRRKKPRSKMSDAEKRREDDVRRDEGDALAVEVDGVPGAQDSDQTDVSTFIKVLATRGFVLDGEGSEALDRSNKMFVKLKFLKAAQPSKGKNATKGKEGATWKPKKKFLKGDGIELDESTVLQPCVYKLR